MITRPVRERSVSEIVEAIEIAIAQTGFEEIGLLSLSSSDYTQIVEARPGCKPAFRRSTPVRFPALLADRDGLGRFNGCRDAEPAQRFYACSGSSHGTHAPDHQ
jgi:hypothetical protein